MSLAAKLPYDHAYAGGYPGIGSQPLPTDADAIDYLSRMATADGAGVETGVAVAVDAFFRGLKATPGLFDAIKASCVLCGARTITGALVPLAGDAPTSNGFVSGDYSRTDGITGDGTSYLDTNQNTSLFAAATSRHHFVFGSGFAVSGSFAFSGLYDSSSAATIEILNEIDPGPIRQYRSGSGVGGNYPVISSGFTESGSVSASRVSSTSASLYQNGANVNESTSNVTPLASSLTFYVFAVNINGSPVGPTNSTLQFWSIGDGLDDTQMLAFHTAATNLMNRLKFALLVGENPSGLDPDTIDYIVRGYEAGGSLE